MKIFLFDFLSILVLFCLRLSILIMPSKKRVLTIFDFKFSYTIHPYTSIINYFLDFDKSKIIWLIIISAWNPSFSKNVQRFFFMVLSHPICKQPQVIAYGLIIIAGKTIFVISLEKSLLHNIFNLYTSAIIRFEFLIHASYST